MHSERKIKNEVKAMKNIIRLDDCILENVFGGTEMCVNTGFGNMDRDDRTIHGIDFGGKNVPGGNEDIYHKD